MKTTNKNRSKELTMLKKHLFFLSLTLINITSVYSMEPDGSSDEESKFTYKLVRKPNKRGTSNGKNIFRTTRRLYTKVEKSDNKFVLTPIGHDGSQLILKYNPDTDEKTKITNVTTGEEFFLSQAEYDPSTKNRPVYLRSRGTRVWEFHSKGNKEVTLTLKTASESDLSQQGRMSNGDESKTFIDIYSGDEVQITITSEKKH